MEDRLEGKEEGGGRVGNCPVKEVGECLGIGSNQRMWEKRQTGKDKGKEAGLCEPGRRGEGIITLRSGS